MSRWLDIGSDRRFALLASDGVVSSDGRQGWNDCCASAITNTTTDEASFALTLVDS